MKVLKFGGSSLADSAGFLNVANIITARTSRSIITVSATATTTDTLHLFIETEDKFAAKQLLSKLFERHHTLVKELELPQPEFLYQQFERLQHQLNKHWDTHHNDEVPDWDEDY